jgi:hypothetical protein
MQTKKNMIKSLGDFTDYLYEENRDFEDLQDDEL